MGAGPWTLYNATRRRLMDGSIDLDNNVFAMSLFTGASNATDKTKVTVHDLTGEAVGGTGYTAGGQVLTNVLWNVADTPDEMRFTADTSEWTASGAGIASVQYAVIWRKSGVNATDYLMLCAALDENGAFTTTSGNKLTVAVNTQGIFEFS